MTKKIFYIIALIAVIMMFVGCPNNPQNDTTDNNPTTEKTQEEKNKATSGLEKDITIIGKIQDTTCDITLNAENGTFTASKSSRTDDVSFSGEFFYYNGKLQLKVTSKNNQTLSSAETFCLTATVAEELLKTDETVTFETKNVTEYETAKTEFLNSNSIKTFDLAGIRFVADTLTISQTTLINGETQSENPQNESAAGCVLDFTANNKVLIEEFFEFDYELNYHVIGNALKIEFIYSVEESLTMQVTFTGTLSDDGSRITNFSGDILQYSNNKPEDKWIISFSDGAFTKKGTITSLTGKTYKATKAKYNNENLTGNIELAFTDTYNFTMKQDNSSLTSLSKYYLVTEGQFKLSAYWEINNNTSFGILSGTISSDFKTISVSADLNESGSIKKLEFEFVLNEENNNTDNDTTFNLTGTRYVCRQLTVSNYDDIKDTSLDSWITSNCFDFVLKDNQLSVITWLPGSTIEMQYSEKYLENKITLTGTLNSEGDNRESNLVGVLSEDMNTITVRGSSTVYITCYSEPIQQTSSYSGVYSKVTNIIDLTGKSYRSESIKLNGENIVGNYVYTLSFTDDSQYDLKLFEKNNETSDQSLNDYYGKYYNSDTTIFYDANGSSGSSTSPHRLKNFSSIISNNNSSITITSDAYSYDGEELGTVEIAFTLVE